MTKPIILCGTGHRPDKLGGYSKSILQRLTLLCSDALEKVKPSVIISGMALGFDTALALSAIESEIDLHAYLPFEGQERRWSIDDRIRYQRILAKCKKVVIVNKGAYKPYKMELRNRAMVDKSHGILALYNPRVTSGGTFNCLKYADLVDKPVIHLWDDWNKLSKEIASE